MQLSDEIYMHRCIQLAQLGCGAVAPNPMVGAVLVYKGSIIGEGFHQQFGGPHAEVNCIASVKEAHRSLISESVLYVSLEPCSHFGKTPPCTNLIIQYQIKSVVIGCRDPFNKVNGSGIEQLRKAGVQVTVGVATAACENLNKRFFTFHLKSRPYIILKWAQTANGKMGSLTGNRLLISSAYTNRMVHKWRSQEAAIAVGTNTAQLDDPSLTTRFWPGKSPVRIFLDKNLRLPRTLHLFDAAQITIVFNGRQHHIADGPASGWQRGVYYYKIANHGSAVQQIATALHALQLLSVLVEGGRQFLQAFIDESCWDELLVITNRNMITPSGLAAPELKNARLTKQESLATDIIQYYHPDE